MGRRGARRRTGKKHIRSRRRGSRKVPRKGLTFGFLMLIIFLLACMGVFMVAMNHGAMSSDMSVLRMEKKISEEKTEQKSLRMSLARLKSPGRVTREATDVLGLMEPSAVIYLKYTRDANGKIVCQSNYEATGRETTRKTSYEETNVDQLPLNGKEQAAIRTGISSKAETR